MKNKKGFTLVEMVITMFILCFTLLALASFAGTLNKATIQSKQITIASNLVQDKLESLKNDGFSGALSSTTPELSSQSGFNYTRSWTVTTTGNIKIVDVVVTIGQRSSSGQILIAE